MHPRNEDIITEARRFVGRPYRHMGRSWETGVDCAGLLVCVANNLGISGFNTHAYSRRPNVAEFDAAMVAAGCKQKPFLEADPGDILRLAESRWPVHCAILTERSIIHAWAPARIVTEEALSSRRMGQISSVWSFPE